MPFKHHAARRHRIPRARYRVRNWRQYDAGLRRRGDLTLWLDEAALAGWRAAPRTTPGGQARYSDRAIELVLMLRLVFHLALRQAEGFAGHRPSVAPHGPMHLRIDSTGRKLFGPGEWQQHKHGLAANPALTEEAGRVMPDSQAVGICWLRPAPGRDDLSPPLRPSPPSRASNPMGSRGSPGTTAQGPRCPSPPPRRAPEGNGGSSRRTRARGG